VRALIVDDSKPVRSILTTALRSLRFDCQEAGDGAEALALLDRGGRTDLVTVNWHMPVMDGLELIRSLRSSPRHRGCKLLMISTEHEQHRIAMAIDAGADAFLPKPFTQRTLFRQLAELGLCEPAAVRSASRGLRVLVVDDSPTIRSVVSRVLSSAAGIERVDVAVDGKAAVEAVRRSPPDVVVLDVEMPVMDGITALREIRRMHPRLPVLMFSSLTQRGGQATIDALLAGANDYLPKPAGSLAEVTATIEGEMLPRLAALCDRGDRASADTVAVRRPSRAERVAVRGIAIGVSTGGPAALAEILPVFAADCPVPILIVQHMPAFFTAQLASRLSKTIGREVREATEGEPLGPGTVLLAPGGRHMGVAAGGIHGRIQLTDTAPEHSCRPAADVLFRTAARQWGAGSLGIVLTGMGRDGLAGAGQIVEAGGSVLAQDEFTSVVWGMPGEVARAGLADAVLPLSQLAAEVLLRLGRRRR